MNLVGMKRNECIVNKYNRYLQSALSCSYGIALWNMRCYLLHNTCTIKPWIGNLFFSLLSAYVCTSTRSAPIKMNGNSKRFRKQPREEKNWSLSANVVKKTNLCLDIWQWKRNTHTKKEHDTCCSVKSKCDCKNMILKTIRWDYLHMFGKWQSTCKYPIVTVACHRFDEEPHMPNDWNAYMQKKGNI